MKPPVYTGGRTGYRHPRGEALDALYREGKRDHCVGCGDPVKPGRRVRLFCDDPECQRLFVKLYAAGRRQREKERQ